MDDPVLVEVMRGGRVESVHRGALCVRDADGATLLALGDMERPVFPRSAIKALQALPLVESGAAERYGLSAAELALACASHAGEPVHAETAAAMLAKAGRGADCLECGAHWPLSGEAARQLAAAGGRPSALHNNCSGKHAGFVCLACGIDADPAGYVRPDHPVQAAIREVLVETTGAAHDMDACGTDGCSIPTYAVPLPSLALAFARFGTGHGLGPQRAKAAALLRASVAAHPEMVAGEGRFDTVLMRALGARAFVKVGAEGVYCAALPELGLGVSLKCADGAARGAEVMVAALIRRFLKPDSEAGAVLDRLAEPDLVNWNGIRVGALRPAEAFLSGKGRL